MDDVVLHNLCAQHTPTEARVAIKSALASVFEKVLGILQFTRAVLILAHLGEVSGVAGIWFFYHISIEADLFDFCALGPELCRIVVDGTLEGKAAPTELTNIGLGLIYAENSWLLRLINSYVFPAKKSSDRLGVKR